MRPTHCPVPAGAAFLVLSLVAQFTSAAVLGRDASSGHSLGDVDRFKGVFRRDINSTISVSEDVTSTTAISSTLSDALSTTSQPGATTTTDVDTVSSDSTIVPTSTATTASELSTTELSTISSDTASLTSDLSTVSSDTASLTSELSTISSDTASLTSELSTISSDTASLTTTSLATSTTASSIPSAPISVTSAPSGTSAAIAQATASASSVSSQIVILIPFIQSWTKDAENLKTDTLNRVNNLVDDLEGVISDLGGDVSSPCTPKKRGLLDLVSSVINTVICATSELKDITGKIDIGDVVGVLPVLTDLTAVNSELDEESKDEDDDDDDDDETQSNESQTKTESDASTATSEASTTASETVTSTTTSGSCLMRQTTRLQPPTNTEPTVTIDPTSGASYVSVSSDTEETSTGLASTTSEAVTSTTSEAVTSTTSEAVTSTTSEAVTSTTSDAPTSVTSDEPTTVTSVSTAEVSSTVSSAEVTSTTSTLTESTSQTSISISTITSVSVVSTTFQTSTTAAPVYPICVVHAGPSVPDPFCQCSTTTDGQTFFTTATLNEGQCSQYTSFPSDITLAPTTTAAPTTAPPVPYIETEGNGDVLSYPSQTVEYGVVAGSISITMTHGLGTPVTISTALPTQTAGNNKGSSNCGSIDNACDRAFEQYEDDTVYTDYTAYVASVKSGILVPLTFGKAGCTAIFECDDYGIGMRGKDIKDAVQFLKDNNDASKCGSTYLSNTCHVTLNYCVSCKATQ